jgi:hypothetical protein
MVASESRECCRDDGFGLRPRQKSSRIEPEGQSPEFLASKNTSNRFMREPACRERIDGCRLFVCEHAVRLSGESRMVERQRVTDDETRIKLGTIETVATQFARKGSSCGRDGESESVPPLDEKTSGIPHGCSLRAGGTILRRFCVRPRGR